MIPPSPRLSLVVPTFKAPQRLRALLRSVASQAVDASLAEVIVVDDGSSDGAWFRWRHGAQ